ncbi:Hsp70 family protein [Phytohabitans suffuscus]|uniref:Molecular chaperone DnaK n=1 Tax=Phytohabitans suffuscus TaxID=624315 RepID=A0A6F8YVB0_9ACTN|nr:hypothetical protein [Phytohabitans suffuscus]BCB90077.1 hypothetical protein Psuf_073900 [Phytohabitans suffuscus]
MNDETPVDGTADEAPVVVGFDLGHGETALAKADPDADTPPEVLDLPGAERRQHITAVAVQADRVLIGRSALVAPDAELHTEFKRQEFDDPTVSRPVRLFVGRLLGDVHAAGVLPATRRVRFTFGAPSSWGDQQRETYAELLRAAIPDEVAVEHVEVVKESRAAMLYARDSGEIRTGGGLASTALIVDLGSSTADYTYVEEGVVTQFVDTGNPDLGAALIDDAIRLLVTRAHPRGAEIDDVVGSTANTTQLRRFRLACREAKEKFFRIAPEQFVLNPHDSALVLHRIQLPDGSRLSVEIELRPAQMDAALDASQPRLGGRSWRQAFRDDLTRVLAKCALPPELVLLTGGPSRMPFVLEIARELAGADRVALGSEPESAIARGLAVAGRIGIRTDRFERDLDELIGSGEIERAVRAELPELAAAMATAAAAGMTERHVIPAFRSWRSGHVDTLRNVVRRVAEGVNDDMSPEKSTRLAIVVAAWQNRLRPRVDELTRPICDRAGLDPGRMKLPPVEVRSGRVTVAVNTGVATDSINTLGNLVTVVVAGVLAMTLFGSGIALLATTGPFAVVVAFVVALFVLRYGKEAAMERAMDINFPVLARKLKGEGELVAELRASAPRKEAELAAQLKAQILKESADKLTDAITREVVAELRDLSRVAQLQIV